MLVRNVILIVVGKKSKRKNNFIPFFVFVIKIIECKISDWFKQILKTMKYAQSIFVTIACICFRIANLSVYITKLVCCIEWK